MRLFLLSHFTIAIFLPYFNTNWKGRRTKNIRESEELIAQVDGGYVKSNDKNRSNFEVLVSQIYAAEDHIHGGVSKNGIRTSGTIINKICSGYN